MGRYSKLFERVQVGKLSLKNRIVMSPMQTRHLERTAAEATYTHWYTEYFRERAKGGVGLIITGHIKAEKAIDPYPLKSIFPVLDSDEKIKEFSEVTETVHRYGAKIAAQLSAGTGRLADVFQPDKWPAAPSQQPSLYYPQLMTRELTKSEIAQLVEAYGKAAQRVKRSGFDALYIHGLAYLIDQFISSCWNHRKDEYGGNLEGRLRFLKECFQNARSSVGGDFPIIVGLALDHGYKGGRKLEETIALAREIEKLGIDAFHVRDGSYDGMETLIPNAHYPEGEVLKNAVLFRKEIKTPLIVDGKLGDPDLGLRAVEEGKADLIGLGRPLLADPDWPIKVKKGQINEIRPCLNCMECFDRVALGKYVGCSVNARLGHEREFPSLPAPKAKKVLIVGGGPAGMEAARIASSRGHRVTLVEKREELGGHLIEGSKPEFKKSIAKFNLWLQRQLMKNGCQVKTAFEVDERFIKELNPDVLIMATGAKPKIPPIPGIGGKNVFHAVEALNGKARVGKKVVIIGAGLVGCDTAHKLAKEGKTVDLVEELPEILLGVSIFNRFTMMRELSSLGVKSHVRAKVLEIKEDGVAIAEEGGKNFLEADTILIATGFIADHETYERFGEMADEVYPIGDIVEARKIYDAVQEGFLIGKEI